MIDRKELIEGLEYCIEAKDKNCPMACPFFKECFSVFKSTEPFYPIMRAALEFLKEQEPKKVITDMYGNAYCPWCSTERTIEMGLRKLHLGTNFCPWCGQEVIWE